MKKTNNKPTFPEIINKIIIDNKGDYLTANEIANVFKEVEPDIFNTMMVDNKRTENENINQIVAQISSRFVRGHLDSNISRTAERPMRYYYSMSGFNNGIKKKQINHPERDLYPNLIEFCKSHDICAMRIEEGSTVGVKEKGKNKWLHPDIVGFKDLSKNYAKETKDLVKECGIERAALYSFEVKDGIIMTTGELREAFFQTVSNSSWANYSYLVAEGIDSKVDDELQLLCKSFNIGFIALNNDSQIYIRAPKTELDCDMMNRISVNKDFKDFQKKVVQSLLRHSNEYIPETNWNNFS